MSNKRPNFAELFVSGEGELVLIDRVGVQGGEGAGS